MIKLLDLIALFFVIMLFSTIWLWYITNNLIIASICSLCFSFIIIFIISHLKGKKKDNIKGFASFMLNLESHKRLALIEQCINTSFEPKLSDDTIICKDLTYIIELISFSTPTLDQIAILARRALTNKASKLIIVTNHTELNTSPITIIPITLVGIELIYSGLQIRENLPAFPRKSNNQNNFAYLLRFTYDKRNIKYYLLSGTTMALLAFITPLTLYYLLFASFSLILAIISIIKKSPRKINSEIFSNRSA